MAQLIETKRIKVLTEHKNYLPPLTPEEKKNLEMGIREHGILTPLVLLKGGTFLLDGHNRLEIAKKIGMKNVPVTIQATNNAEDWILRNQLSRRNLSELVRDKLVAALAKSIKAKSKNKAEELQELATTAKMSPSTLKRVEKQQKEIEALPEATKKQVEEAGTRRAANLIMQTVQPQSATVKLKNDILVYRSLLIGIADGAINLEEDGVKGIDDMIQSAVNATKMAKIIDFLEKKVKELKEERNKEIDAIKTRK